MLKKCEKTGIFFKGRKLQKDEIIEVNNSEELGHYQGLFSDVIEEVIEIIEDIVDGIKIKKPRKGGK